MPFIIAATDFSEVANNAVNYACSLASAQRTEVMIIHSFIVPVMFSDIPMPVSLMNDAQRDAEAQMKRLSDSKAALYPDVKITGKVIYGDIITVIEEYSENNYRPWLVVAGNSSNAENGSWPDSVLIDAFKKLKFPVLGVPPEASFGQVNKLCLAYDNKHRDNDTALQQAADISKRLNATLHVLNVQTDVHNRDNNEYIDDAAQKILDPSVVHYHFVYESDDINNTVDDFLKVNNIDWLLMIPHKHSFFQGLFHKSHTSSFAKHVRIPILALHEKI